MQEHPRFGFDALLVLERYVTNGTESRISCVTTN